MQADFVNQLYIKTKDELDCSLTGLVKISSSELLVVDTSNATVKIFNVNVNAMTSYLKLSDKPWDAAGINSSSFVITLPLTDKVLFLNRHEDLKLSETRRMKVKKGCYGIDHYNGVLALTTNWPPSVQVVDMHGRILREITTVFNLPGSLHLCLSHDGREVFVTSTNDNTVQVLTIDGRLKTRMDEIRLQSVRGIAVTRRRTVFVCGDGNHDNCDKVSMFLPDIGKTVSVAVPNVMKPYCIVFCEDKKRLYISESCTTAEGNYIKVYDWRYTEHS